MPCVVGYSNPAAYERFMGRWTARLAPSFVRFADVQVWQAAEAVAPDAVFRQRSRNPLPRYATPNDLEALRRNCGLSDIKMATLELSMEFPSFDDYWQPFLGGSTPTSAFAAATITFCHQSG